MRAIRLWLLMFMAALFLAHSGAAQSWNLVWSDDFNGPAGPFTPTSSNNQWWTFETGQGIFGTGEIEHMISDGSTSYLDGNGHLVIKTYAVTNAGQTTYYSARIKTQVNNTFGMDFSYGRMEASIQIPTSQGIWPAFWMLGSNIASGVPWPGCGEIDIMENNGSKPLRVLGTIHGVGYANTGLGGHFDSTTPFTQGYHTYGVIWSPYLVQFYVDDPANIYASYTPGEIMGVGTNPGNNTSTLGQWDFYGHPFFIIFDVAVGGGFPGPPGAGTVLPQYMNIDYVRVYQATPPAGPTSLTATPISNSQVQLSWSPSATAGSDPNITYNIFRSTTSGTEHSITNTNMTNMISTGVTGTSFTDVMLTPGATYYYEVTATGQESGESVLSNEAKVTLPATGTNVQPIAISAGSLVGTANFVQDTGYNLGATNAYPDVIDVSGVANPAPQGVYRTERWAPTTYTIPNLTPSGSYNVRLHFAETAFNGTGQRAFNVAINGTQVLQNYDIFADAGAEFKATEKVFTVTADNNGTITIALTAGTNGAPHTNPSLRGIEVICDIPTAPTALSATAISSSQINLSWGASTSACAVTYNIFRSMTAGFTPSVGNQIASGVSGTTYSDNGLAAATTYYYLVEAANVGGTSAASNQASATTNLAGSVTTLTSNNNPSSFGQAVIFTATVSALPPASGTPTGIVQFNDGNTLLGSGTLSNGTATFNTTSLAIGNHSITAVYGGDATFSGSRSAALNQSVTGTGTSPTTTTITDITVSNRTPGQEPSTVHLEQTITVTATVVPNSGMGTPTGTVALLDNGVQLGASPNPGPMGQVTFGPFQLGLSMHSIVAKYFGDSTFQTSSSVPSLINHTPRPR